MRHTSTAAVALIVLSGCAIQHETLAQYGDYKLDGDLLKTFSVEHSGMANLGALPGCVAGTLTNDAVNIGDSSGSFVGQYTGNYYSIGSNREIGGGSTLQYVSQDGSEVVAKGTTRYTSGIVERVVRFTVKIKDDGQKRSYQFTNLEQVQTQTGLTPNTGYSRIHARPGGGAGHVLGSLKSVAGEIDACLM